MTLTTDIPLIAEGDGDARAAFITGLTDLAAFLATHPEAPLPGTNGHLWVPVRVPGRTQDEKLASLEAIAEASGTQVTATDDGHGTRMARRDFGPVTYAACVSPADIGTLRWLADAAKARAARVPDGTAA